AGLVARPRAGRIDLDAEEARAVHRGRERLRAAHPAEARAEDPAALPVAAEVLLTGGAEGLVGALQDPLGADVDPRAGGHLPVHRQAHRLEAPELVPRAPRRNEQAVGEQNARRVLVRAELADRAARLDEQRLVGLELLELAHDAVEVRPRARGLAGPAVD